MSITSNHEQQTKSRFSAAGHKRSGISREQAQRISYDENHGERFKGGGKRFKNGQGWGRNLKLNTQLSGGTSAGANSSKK